MDSHALDRKYNAEKHIRAVHERYANLRLKNKITPTAFSEKCKVIEIKLDRLPGDAGKTYWLDTPALHPHENLDLQVFKNEENMTVSLCGHWLYTKNGKTLNMAGSKLPAERLKTTMLVAKVDTVSMRVTELKRIDNVPINYETKKNYTHDYAAVYKSCGVETGNIEWIDVMFNGHTDIGFAKVEKDMFVMIVCKPTFNSTTGLPTYIKKTPEKPESKQFVKPTLIQNPGQSTAYYYPTMSDITQIE
jgi:hypothetical protein